MPPIHDALRAHLAKLDREIILQHEVLTKLKHDRTLARRELNAVSDPVARLPLEISSQIFLSCLATSGTRFPQPGALHLPMLLLNICAAWSRIAVSTPSLWAGIRILFQDGPQSLQKLVPRWLARAGNRPLSLSLSGYATFDSKVLRIVWSRARQLKHLELCEVEPERRGPRKYKLEREQRLGGWTMNLWEGGTGPGSLPALETLAIRGLEGSPRASLDSPPVRSSSCCVSLPTSSIASSATCGLSFRRAGTRELD
jgi:hypothetical protein